MRRLLATSLALCLGTSPALAQVRSVPVEVPALQSGAVGASFDAAPPVFDGVRLSPTSLVPTLLAHSASPTPSAFAAPAAVDVSAPSALKAVAPGKAKAVALQPGLPVAKRLAAVTLAASKAVAGLDKAGADASSSMGAAQFSALTGETFAEKTADDVSAPAFKPSAFAALSPAAAKDEAPETKPEPKKPGITTVFKDPERNKAFWRYASAYTVFFFGFQMYIVGLPYLISSMTRNSMLEHHDPRAGNAEAVKEVVRNNRSLARIAHWTAQGLSYVVNPFFARSIEEDGPGKWLARSHLIRAASLAAVPALFFLTGVMSAPVALGALLILFAVQSFYQGVSVTTGAAAATRIMGAKGVTSEERLKANSILTFIAGALSIVSPIIAGSIAKIGPVMGKEGVGGAVIYGIYALAVAVTGLIYASIKILKNKPGDAKPAAPAAAPAKGSLKTLWSSFREGARLVFKDRFLRTLLALSLVSSLFTDPLTFNVLPEYVESLVAKDPGSIGALLHVPVVGWFFKSLTSTPMGNFALMMVMASVGSIVATFLMKPATKLFRRLGFKTDEAMTIPFYFLAALELPLFLLMLATPSMLGVVLIYGLQALASGFIGIAVSGLFQKKLGEQADGAANKILAAQSLMGIVAAIISTFAYGFLLKGLPIGVSMTIAAVAMGVTALLRLAAPFLSFTRAQRKPPQDPPAPPDGPGGQGGGHAAPHGLQSVQL